MSSVALAQQAVDGRADGAVAEQRDGDRGGHGRPERSGSVPFAARWESTSVPRPQPGSSSAIATACPVGPQTPVVSLGEGSTPLVRAPRLGAVLGVDLWLKLEGLNPTGSFKDRGMTLALSKAAEDGATAVVCASTGNTSASAAAYAARAGIRCVVVVPSRQHRARQARAGAGARRARGADRGVVRRRPARSCATSRERHPITLVNNLNPYRLEGQKTAAWEVVEELGGAPDWLALPGRQRRQHHGLVARLPRARGGRRRHRRCRACWARRRRARRRWCEGRDVDAARHRGDRHPHRRAGAPRRGRGGRARVGRRLRGRARRGDPGLVPPPGARGGRLLRAVERHERRRAGPRPRRRPGAPRARAWSACSPATGSRIPTRPCATSICRRPCPPAREAIERIALA